MISYLTGDYEVFQAPDSAKALIAPSANKKVSAFVCCYINSMHVGYSVDQLNDILQDDRF